MWSYRRPDRLVRNQPAVLGAGSSAIAEGDSCASSSSLTASSYPVCRRRSSYPVGRRRSSLAMHTLRGGRSTLPMRSSERRRWRRPESQHQHQHEQQLLWGQPWTRQWLMSDPRQWLEGGSADKKKRKELEAVEGEEEEEEEVEDKEDEKDEDYDEDEDYDVDEDNDEVEEDEDYIVEDDDETKGSKAGKKKPPSELKILQEVLASSIDHILGVLSIRWHDISARVWIKWLVNLLHDKGRAAVDLDNEEYVTRLCTAVERRAMGVRSASKLLDEIESILSCLRIKLEEVRCTNLELTPHSGYTVSIEGPLSGRVPLPKRASKLQWNWRDGLPQKAYLEYTNDGDAFEVPIRPVVTVESRDHYYVVMTGVLPDGKSDTTTGWNVTISLSWIDPPQNLKMGRVVKAK